MMLRIQNERLGGTPMLATTREYSRTFGLNARVLERREAGRDRDAPRARSTAASSSTRRSPTARGA